MLEKEAINELNNLTGFKALFAEWLARWFDGASHTVGGLTATFPQCHLAFDDSPGAQPLSNPRVAAPKPECEIRLVVLSGDERATWNADSEGEGKLAGQNAQLNFWVNADAPGAGNSELLADTVAQLLKGILANPDARYDLAVKGITHLTPQRPRPMPSGQGSTRLVICGAQVQFKIR